MTTVDELLADARQKGATLDIVNGQVRCKAPKGFLTTERREAFRDLKDQLVERLAREWKPSAQGVELLQPYLPVIRAAHRNELNLTVLVGETPQDANEYVCRVAAGIWYGYALDDPLLPVWLQNLQRCRQWFEVSVSYRKSEVSSRW